MTDILDVARQKGPSEYKHETGFTENWGASLGQALDEGLSASRFIHEGVIRDTRADILKLIRDGDIPDHVTQYEPNEEVTGGINYDKAALWANDNLDKQFKTTKELKDSIRDELKVRRDYAKSVREDANWFGVAGDIAGSFHGFALDPINDATMLLGAGQLSRGVIALARREAIIAGTSEAAIQPFVYSWKKDIGADYSAKEAVGAIVIATGMGATVGAITAGIGKLLRKKPVTKEEKTAYQAAEYLQNELKEAHDVKMDAGEYLGNIEKAAQQINDAKPEFLPQAEVKLKQKAGFEVAQGDEVDIKFDTLSKETPDAPTIISHEKDMKGDTIINYGRATDEVKKIEAQELDLESIRGCLIGG